MRRNDACLWSDGNVSGLGWENRKCHHALSFSSIFTDVSTEEFKTWLFSKRVTEVTYAILRQNGLHEAAFFALLESDENVQLLQIKPFAQELLIKKLVKSFQVNSAEVANGEDKRKEGEFFILAYNE